MNEDKAGVYLIENTANGSVYVGSTGRKIATRWQEHKAALKKGIHRNRHLQAAWDSYGAGCFQFQILETVESLDDLLIAEQVWMDYFRAQGVACYNFREEVRSNLGIKMPPRTSTHRQNMGRSIRAHYETDEGQQLRNRMRKTWWQRLASPQSISKRAEGHRGVKELPEAVQRRADSCAKVWDGFVAPDGTVYRNIKNLSAFCRERNLSQPHMLEVYHGTRNHHRGWRRLDDE